MKIYVVGGAVRDIVLGLAPKDYDYVAVGATHDEMIAQGFSKVGADFPVYLHPTTGDEYALARTERKTGEGYLGFEVDSSPDVSLKDDLSRRDLTINAMAMSSLCPGPLSPVIDPHNGMRDLEAKVLRHVSDAFIEDPLRVVRLARFYARYDGFSIAPETMAIAREIVARGDLNHLPNERFWAELVKVFDEARPDRFFDILIAFDCDLHVKFFHRLYGAMTRRVTDRIMNLSLAVKELAKEQRLIVHSALTACQDSLLDNRTAELYRNVRFLRSLSEQRVTEDSLYELLKMTKAFSDGPQVSDLRAAITSAAMIGERFVLRPQDLDMIVKAARQVTSADYTAICGPGKILGNMIEKGRKNAIAEVLNLRED